MRSPGPDAQTIADAHVRERDVRLRAHRVDAAGGRRREAEQALDRPLVRLRARSSSTWPSSTSVDDHRRRLEVDGDLVAVAAERRREQTGRERRDDAEPNAAELQRPTPPALDASIKDDGWSSDAEALDQLQEAR